MLLDIMFGEIIFPKKYHNKIFEQIKKRNTLLVLDIMKRIRDRLIFYAEKIVWFCA